MPNANILRQYSGGAVQTTIASHVSAIDTQINCIDLTTWPTGQSGSTLVPVAATINPGAANEEKIFYGPRGGNTLQNCERGADGTTAQVHEAGEPILHTFTAQDAREANALVVQANTWTDFQSVPVRQPEGVYTITPTVVPDPNGYARYQQVGKTVHVAVTQLIQCTSGSGPAYSFPLPVKPKHAGVVGPARIENVVGHVETTLAGNGFAQILRYDHLSISVGTPATWTSWTLTYESA